ncbi:uncharacterized protein C8Q71DRAFT_190700 [Rhodofomes roseus]|uniref:Uncharacterized protein n=1 Tax=Rhodofomes roseus TaxID=34475 RepID=A0ABQ8K9Y6_9APHY|nr:uncharacterized protein C8Q71DRAFT_190700 [Rhodofomes roseus]KAH9833607.1 hypothetical protein C8Q71DRAFT_190700 [Rhodofomes roseus]
MLQLSLPRIFAAFQTVLLALRTSPMVVDSGKTVCQYSRCALRLHRDRTRSRDRVPCGRLNAPFIRMRRPLSCDARSVVTIRPCIVQATGATRQRVERTRCAPLWPLLLALIHKASLVGFVASSKLLSPVPHHFENLASPPSLLKSRTSLQAIQLPILTTEGTMPSVSSRSSSTSSTDYPVPAKPTWLPEITSAAELVHLGTLYLSFFLYTHCPARWLPEKVLSETLTIPRHLHPQDTAIRAWLYGWACYVEQHRRAPEEVAADSWHWAMELMFWPGRPLTGKNAVEFAWNRRVIPQQPGWVRVSWYHSVKEMLPDARAHPEMYAHLQLEPDGSLKIGDVRRKWGMETMVVRRVPAYPLTDARADAPHCTCSSSSGTRTGTAYGPP